MSPSRLNFNLLCILFFIPLSALADTASQYQILTPQFQFECPRTEPNCNADLTTVFPIRSSDSTDATLLINGERSLAARLASLAGDEMLFDQIKIQALILTADESGKAIAKRLIEIKSKNPNCVIQVNVDSLSNIGVAKWVLTQNLYRILMVAKIKVIGNWIQATDDYSLFHPFTIDHRYHDKIWFVQKHDQNGKQLPPLGILGGMNIANEYMRTGPGPEHHWRDQDILVTGAAAEDMKTAFDQNSLDFKRNKKAWSTLDDALSISKPWAYLWDNVQNPLKQTDDPEAAQNVQNALNANFDVNSELTPVRVRFVHSRPRYKEKFIEQTYINMINDTRHDLMIANAYFIPTAGIIDALKNAKARGVHVLLLTNSKETNDVNMMTVASRNTYYELLSAPGSGSIDIYEWQGKLENGPQTDMTIHAKFLVSDSRAGIIGSYNLDPRSENLNSETVMVFESTALGPILADHYSENDLAKSKKITLEQASIWHDPKNPFDFMNHIIVTNPQLVNEE